MAAVVPQTIGKYQIIDRIGQGGMGTVYLARDPDSGRRVAIKTVRVDAPEEFVRRFAKEGKLARLEHENIVTIYETGRSEDGRPYIVMEYIEGLSLDKLVSPGSLPLVEKLKCVQQLCEGLYYAHSNDVIHRDIKPANAIRRKHDGRVKILDFGIARDESRTDETVNTVLIGSPHYMSPERLNEARGDARVDIFAAGVTLYYLITGNLPFDGNYEEVRAKILHDPYPPLSEHLSNYPAKLDEIVSQALAKNRLDRYASAQDFADDLSSVIDELNADLVLNLLQEAERLLAEGNYRFAEDKANQAVKIDRGNRRAKELRARAGKLYEQDKEEKKLRELLREIDGATYAKRFDDAVRLIEEALQFRPGDQALVERLLDTKNKRRKQRELEEFIVNATVAENGGDLTGALMLYLKAIDIDPSNESLRAKAAQLQEERERLDQRLKIQTQIDGAKRKLAERRFLEAIGILEEIKRARGSHPELDSLYHDGIEGQKRDESAKLSEQFVLEAQKHLATGERQKALEVVDRGLATLPSDTRLLSLKKKIADEERDARKREQIEAVVSEVERRGVLSVPDALNFLTEVMSRYPMAERLESLKRELLERQKRLVKQERRTRCMLEVSAAFNGDDYSAAVKVIETYLLEYHSDPEIDELLRDASAKLEQELLSHRITECASRAGSFIDQGRFEDALLILVPLEAETHPPVLRTLIDEAKAGKADVDRKLKVLSQRISQMWKEGKLGEAIVLIEGQTTALLNSSLLQELLVRLRNELAKVTAITEAISRSRRKVENGEWATAREPLEDVRRVYGDFEALAQATAEFDRYRSRAADQSVTKSIEEADALTLAGDKGSARKALETTAQLVPFATPAVVQDWQEHAKRLKVEPPSQGPIPKPPKFAIWTIAAGIVLVAAITAAVLYFRRTLPPPPLPPTETSIRLTKVPPGARISIDGEASGPSDANGELRIKVKPGVSHRLEVSKDGFDPFQDDLTVNAGEILNEPIPPFTSTGTAKGTLSFQGFPKEFTLFVDGAPRTVRDGREIKLPEGSPRIRYSVTGYKDSSETRVPIVRNQETPLIFNKHLEKLPPPPLTAAAQPAPAPESAPPPTSAPPSTALPTGSLSASPNPVERGQSVILKWQVNNASSVSISDVGDELAPQGTKTVSPIATTTYQLRANGVLLAQTEVDVTVPRPNVELNPPPTSKTPSETKPTGPDRAALEQAIDKFKGVFVEASGKSPKECASIFSTAYQGMLKDFSPWCGRAKSFKAIESCGSTSGPDEAPSLSCTEKVTGQNGGKSLEVAGGQRTFHFAKNPDGSWRITKYE